MTIRALHLVAVGAIQWQRKRERRLHKKLELLLLTVVVSQREICLESKLSAIDWLQFIGQISVRVVAAVGVPMACRRLELLLVASVGQIDEQQWQR